MANMSKWRILMNAVNKTLVKKAHYLKRNSLLSREIVLSSRYYHSSIPWEDLKTFHAVKIDLMEAMRNGWVPLENEHFSLELESQMKAWKREGRVGVWLHVPISLAGYMPPANELGFTFHHALGNEAVLSVWLSEDRPSRFPLYAHHQVGVAGFVYDTDTQKVLMIKDKHKFRRWKFPGGLCDPGEEIVETAEREVLEETGVKSKFQSVLAWRHFHDMPNAFGASDFYFICRMDPVTTEINHCRDEVLDCQWIPLDDLVTSDTTNLTHKIVEIFRHGLLQGFETVDIEVEQVNLEILPGRTYKLYHRNVL